MVTASPACYSVAVQVRHVALAAMAIAVLGMGVYLFVEVHASPAVAQPAAPSAPPPVAADAPKPAAVINIDHGAAPPIPHTAGPPAHASVAPKPQLGEPVPAAPEKGEDGRTEVKLEALMDQANKAYDRQDFDEAKLFAGKALAQDPKSVRMMRIMVSASCIDGDNAIGQKYYEQLPKFDREQMKTRCDRYGVTFKEPAQ
jgi:hypothetical protein